MEGEREERRRGEEVKERIGAEESPTSEPPIRGHGVRR